MSASIPSILHRLQQSKFRARFRLGKKEQAYYCQKGAAAIRGHAVDFIQARLAPANPKNDGRQTPMKNHPVFIAQHATATCCRSCLEKWHGIAKGHKLTEREVEFSVELIMAWLQQQTTTKAAQ